MLSRKLHTQILMFLVFAVVLTAQQNTVLAQTPITARVDRTSLAADEQLVLTVTINGDFLTPPQPDMSQVTDFIVVNSSQSTRVSIVNGKMTSQGVFIYRLQPLAEGDLVIGPISVNIDGTVHQTEPVTIEVLPAGTRTQPALPQEEPDGTETPDTLSGQDFFVEAEVSNLAPYLGEQIIYTFRLYQATDTNIFGQPDYRPPTFTDFWSSEVIDRPNYNVRAAGRNYLVSEIRTALFPANLGELTIEPARLVISGGLLKPDVKLETKPVKLDVAPLPDNAPDGFNGAVGQFEIRTRLNRTESKINEPLTLVIEIEGVGNLETLVEPAIPDVPGWRFFDSQAETVLQKKGDQLGGVRRFERLVVPGQAGEQLFPTIQFSYYNPETDQYEIVASESIPVKILPDDSAQPLPLLPGRINDEDRLDLINNDIVHIKPVTYSLNTSAVVSTIGQAVYWGLWIMPLFIMGATLVWKRRQLRFERDPAYARSTRARDKALKRLAEAQHADSTSTSASAVGKALLGYLSDKLDVSTTGLTNAALLNLLRQAAIQPDLVEKVREVLLQVDIGRFAPIPEGDVRALISETRLLINQLEKEFGK